MKKPYVHKPTPQPTNITFILQNIYDYYTNRNIEHFSTLNAMRHKQQKPNEVTFFLHRVFKIMYI